MFRRLAALKTAAFGPSFRFQLPGGD